MPTRRNKHLTRQAGEHSVASELSRRGFAVTILTERVPSCDIIGTDGAGRQLLVRVKVTSIGKWQFDLRELADIEMDGSRQSLHESVREPWPGLLCILIQLSPIGSACADRFFLLPWHDMGTTVITHHNQYLADHAGTRPRTPSSVHSAMKLEQFTQWENRWDLLTRRVRGSMPLRLKHILEAAKLGRANAM